MAREQNIPKHMREGVESDWGFATPDVLDELRRICAAAARRNKYIDEDDAFQELCLYLSVRPERQVSMEYIRSTAYRHLQELAEKEQEHQKRHPLTLTPWLEEGDDE